jgi:hypothetical protein
MKIVATPNVLNMSQKKILILSDNPDWSMDYALAFKELGQADRVKIVEFDGRRKPSLIKAPALVYARCSPSAPFRGKPLANEHMLEAVVGFESRGIAVVNGSLAIQYELDKGKQFALLANLGIAIPKTILIADKNNAQEILKSALEMNGPFLVKPTKGGSGAGIISFQSADDFEKNYLPKFSDPKNAGQLTETLLLQELLPYEDQADPFILRFEFIGGQLLYGLKTRVTPGVYNNCAADACQEGLCGIDPVQDEKFSILYPGHPLYHRVIPKVPIEKIKSFLQIVRSEIAGLEFMWVQNQLFCIDANVANTNYGRRQEQNFERSTGTKISGHRRVAEFLLGKI